MDMLKNVVILMWLYDDVVQRNLLESWYVARLEGLTLVQKK